jgi:hypothetical protein
MDKIPKSFTRRWCSSNEYRSSNVNDRNTKTAPVSPAANTIALARVSNKVTVSYYDRRGRIEMSPPRASYSQGTTVLSLFFIDRRVSGSREFVKRNRSLYAGERFCLPDERCNSFLRNDQPSKLLVLNRPEDNSCHWEIDPNSVRFQREVFEAGEMDASAGKNL